MRETKFVRYTDDARRPRVRDCRGVASKPLGVFAYYLGDGRPHLGYARDRPVVQELALVTDKVLDARRGSRSMDAATFRRWVEDDEFEADPAGMRRALVRMGYEALLLDDEAVFLTDGAFRVARARRRR